MPDLDFTVTGALATPFAATPQLSFALRLVSPTPVVIHTVALRCQIQIEATRRRYTPEEQARIVDLFGEPERWSQTLRTMLWTHVGVVIPRFTTETVAELPVPCTFDFNVAATKYFNGLDEGDLPLRFLFSGTVFHEDEHGQLQVAPIPWSKEATYRLPVAAWRGVVDAYYPNTAWLCLRRDVFQDLFEFKARHGLPTWEQAIERALMAAGHEKDAVPS
jgi:hypothetical protein